MWIDTQQPFFSMTPQQIVAMTAYGENRGGGVNGMQSVINVIQTRRLYPTNYAYEDLNILVATNSPYHAVCLKQYQFSCYNIGDPNRGILLRLAQPGAFDAQLQVDASLRTAWNLVQSLEAGTLVDITGGANHYFAVTITPPWWVKDMVYRTTIAGQAFYANPPFYGQQPQKMILNITGVTPEQQSEATAVTTASVISAL